ncbi:alpha/beta hydrolase [Candidatus Micrarchaeota archaeon]|nr:alpha/beta hydrolase [Candidatus Micrarchaeota archaeon]
MKNYIILFIISLLIFGCIGQPIENKPIPVGANNTNTQNIQPPETQAMQAVAQEISFSSEGWTIYGSMYPAVNSNPSTTIVLAHMFSHDRTDYSSEFVNKLHNEIPNAVIIAIDLRGHGRSTNKGRDSDLSAQDIAGMKNDVIGAKNFVKSRYSSVNSAYAIGASIGSTASMLAAGEDREFTKVAMLAPGLEYREVDIRTAAEAFRGDLFLVSSNNDPYATESANELTRISGARTKQTKIYPEGHGSEIFGNEAQVTPKLDDLLVQFLRN